MIAQGLLELKKEIIQDSYSEELMQQNSLFLKSVVFLPSAQISYICLISVLF